VQTCVLDVQLEGGQRRHCGRVQSAWHFWQVPFELVTLALLPDCRARPDRCPIVSEPSLVHPSGCLRGH
jgi:hypothetical protein